MVPYEINPQTNVMGIDLLLYYVISSVYENCGMSGAASNG
jgi:hypothetical protein